jgi:hypothetical protein
MTSRIVLDPWVRAGSMAARGVIVDRNDPPPLVTVTARTLGEEPKDSGRVGGQRSVAGDLQVISWLDAGEANRQKLVRSPPPAHDREAAPAVSLATMSRPTDTDTVAKPHEYARDDSGGSATRDKDAARGPAPGRDDTDHERQRSDPDGARRDQRLSSTPDVGGPPVEPGGERRVLDAATSLDLGEGSLLIFRQRHDRPF